MKKILACLLAILLLYNAKAQNDSIAKTKDNVKKVKPIKTDADNRFTITYDYTNGTVNHGLPSDFKIKRIRPKVGSFISIKIINLPDGFTVNGEAEFENGNIEGAGMFGSFFKPETPPTKEAPVENKKPAPDSTQNDAKKTLANKTDSIDKMTSQKILTNQSQTKVSVKNMASFQEIIDQKQKLNIDNFKTVLKIDDVKNYLFSSNRAKDNLLAAAKADYDWQQYIITELKKNMEQQLKVRDSMIAALSKSVDKEIQEKPLITKKPMQNKSLTDIQVPNSDLVNLKITVKDNKGDVVSTVPLSYYNRAGYKIDFSTGFFFTHLEDQEYKAINKLSAAAPFTAIDTVYQIKQKEKGKGKIAIGVLAHYYPRWFKYFNLGASCGFSYQAENRIVNFLTGLSVICGNQQRFIISGGASFGKIKELDTNFFVKERDYHKSVLNDKTEIPVTERLKSSLFFGISYNLGTINNSKSIKRTF